MLRWLKVAICQLWFAIFDRRLDKRVGYDGKVKITRADGELFEEIEELSPGLWRYRRRRRG